LQPVARRLVLTPRRLPWILLGVAAPVVFFVGVAENQVHGTAAFYAAVSRQIVETGIWNPLHHGPVPYFLKPPLQFWLAGLNIQALGATNLAATLWPRLFGLGCVALTALIGRRLYGPTAGVFAGLLCVANGTLVENSITFRHDSALLFGILLSLWAYLEPGGRWRPPVFYGGMALAVLSKGPQGLLPLALAAAHAAWADRLVAPWRAAARPWLVWSLLLVLPLLWVLDHYARFGDAFFIRLARDAASGGSTGIADHVQRVAYHYLIAPILRWLPFSPFMVWGVARAARRSLRGPARDRHQPVDRMLVLWTLGVILILSLRFSHRFRYMLMVLPPLALLGGRELARLTGGRIPLRASRAAAGVLLAVLVALAALRPSFDTSDGMRGVAIMRRLFDEELGAPDAPVPVLLPAGVEIGGYGGQQSIRDWIYYYLHRRIQVVRPAEITAGEPGRLLFVYWDHIEEMRRTLPLRVLVQGRREYLVAYRPDDGG
jgi:4-amino-4-deoxy-L-arabinose transferase-like glycosyltransferase